MELGERLFPRLLGPDSRGCRIWPGSTTSQGYGRISYNKVVHRTHRVAWELVNGPIPDGMNVLHHCDNPPCCNAWDTKHHLFLGTYEDNNHDRASKGRNSPRTGTNNGRAKLTVFQVQDIRTSSGSNRELAELYGVTAALIYQVRQNRIWTHV